MELNYTHFCVRIQLLLATSTTGCIHGYLCDAGISRHYVEISQHLCVLCVAHQGYPERNVFVKVPILGSRVVEVAPSLLFWTSSIRHKSE